MSDKYMASVYPLCACPFSSLKSFFSLTVLIFNNFLFIFWFLMFTVLCVLRNLWLPQDLETVFLRYLLEKLL